MAIKGAIPMRNGDVFPHGCFVVGEVTPMRDFDRSTREQAIQALDRDTGELVWTVDVVDADPEARDKTVRIKITAPQQPVPPETAPGVPFRPVEFENLTATPTCRRWRRVGASSPGRSGPAGCTPPRC